MTGCIDGYVQDAERCVACKSGELDALQAPTALSRLICSPYHTRDTGSLQSDIRAVSRWSPHTPARWCYAGLLTLARLPADDNGDTHCEAFMQKRRS